MPYIHMFVASIIKLMGLFSLLTGAKTVNGEIVSQDVENGHSLKRVENKGGDEKINKTDSLQPQQNR